VIAAHLTPREEKIIRLRYGIGEPRHYSLEEMSIMFSLTGEGIRQIEVKALKKLRKHDVDLRPLL
ncbi:MAG: sigma factor-like helix-turn-helix DNA-binding protein, partial [Nanoarchaeota archaeon]